MSHMPGDTPTDAIKDFEKRADELTRQTKLIVFVCGPAVFDVHGHECSGPGPVLRRTISDRIEQEGHSYIWGEHLVPKSMDGGRTWIKRFNDADKEILFAVDAQTDLVVIFPYSSGSLAELGAFCVHPEICKKLLVVFHKPFETEHSFVVRALAKAARGRHATIRFRDYNHPDKVWAAVRKEIARLTIVKTVAMTHAER